MKNYTAQAVYGTIGAVTFGLAMNATTVQAQIIATPTGDPGATGTIVTPINTQIDITGGTQAGSALFHSFTQFDVSQGQTANFQTPAAIQNVLTRVTNGVPSTIDGTLQLSGAKANLYFMNPAGIVFGPNVNLNLPASFVGTTANSISRLSDYDGPLFSASGENNYESLAIRDSEPAFKLRFSDIANNGSIVNFGNLSVPNDLILIGGAVGSATDINGPKNLSIGVAIAGHEWEVRPSDINGRPALMRLFRLADYTGNSFLFPESENFVVFQRSDSRSSNISLKVGDITIQDVDVSGWVELLGNQVKVENIQSESISIGGSKSILAGHLSTSVNNPENPYNGIIFDSMPGISLGGPDIQVSSILAKSDITKYGQILGGRVSINASGIFKVTGVIPNTANLGRIRSDIISASTSEIPISIAAEQSVTMRQSGNSLIEGANLERDSNGYAIYRLASNPDIRVEIVAVNPENGSLILKNQTTGEIIVGDQVTIRSVNFTSPSDISSTKGLVVRLDQRNGSLVELSGAVKRKFSTDSNNLKYGGDYQSQISLGPSRSSIDDLNEIMFGNPPIPDFASANPIGGPLPGSYSSSRPTITDPFPLSSELQAAIDQHNQKTAVITTPTPTPTLTPVPTSESTPEPSAPKFDRTSILNATIDPTDTINLSAGAIQGAAINPGGLLKVELDTRNPEGVLTRKVTTK